MNRSGTDTTSRVGRTAAGRIELRPALRRLAGTANLIHGALIFIGILLGALAAPLSSLFSGIVTLLGSPNAMLPYPTMVLVSAVLSTGFALLLNHRYQRQRRALLAELEGSDLLQRIFGGWLDDDPLPDALPAITAHFIRIARARRRGLSDDLNYVASSLRWYIRYPNGGNPMPEFRPLVICLLGLLCLPFVFIGLLFVSGLNPGGSSGPALLILPFALMLLFLFVPVGYLLSTIIRQGAGMAALSEHIQRTLDGGAEAQLQGDAGLAGLLAQYEAAAPPAAGPRGDGNAELDRTPPAAPEQVQADGSARKLQH